MRDTIVREKLHRTRSCNVILQSMSYVECVTIVEVLGEVDQREQLLISLH